MSEGAEGGQSGWSRENNREGDLRESGVGVGGLDVIIRDFALILRVIYNH